MKNRVKSIDNFVKTQKIQIKIKKINLIFQFFPFFIPRQFAIFT